MQIEDAIRITNELLALPDPPDAFTGINDLVIFAVMKELKKSGYKIPEEIGLVGFVDEFHATFSSPELTSVVHPTREIGIKAAELFFRRKEDPSFVQSTVLQTSLTCRDSSARKH